MNIEQINCFLILGKYLNFTKTAKLMYTTQPTVSRKIKMLEDELGFQLVERDATPLKLTPAGEYVYPKFKEAYELFDSAIHEVRDKFFAENGSLHLSCLVSLNLDEELTGILDTAKESHPKVNFACEKQDLEVIYSKLNNMETDIAITFEPRSQEKQDNIEQIFLFESPGICLFSKKHPIAQKKDKSLLDFKDETFVCLDEKTSHRGINGIYKICSDYGFSCKNIVRVPNIDSTLFYVKSCQGVAILDKTVHMIDDDCFDYIDLPIASAALSVVGIWNKENSNPILHTLKKILVQHFKLK